MKRQDCPHIGELKIAESDKRACEVCGKSDHPRLCTSCGAVHCCESDNAHNTEHFHKTGHPIIKSLPPPGFTWCYECNDYLES